MADSSIEWTEKTWNPVAGCEAVSPGCAHCYAATMTRRLEAMGQADYSGLTTAKHFNGVVRCLPDKLDIPLRWRKPRRIFVNSMSDLFHKDVPDEFIAAVFGAMALARRHTYQVLTKRAARLPQFFRECADYSHPVAWCVGRYSDRRGELKGSDGAKLDEWPLPNVWLGVSVENQQQADERIPWLLKTPAAVRWLSCEPLLGPIDLEPVLTPPPGIDWVIVGGESGPGARPCDIRWIRSIVEQCKAAGVACFVKQLGAHPFRGDRPLPMTTPCGLKEVENRIRLNDKKGGDIEEFPSDLRVRQYPLEKEAA